MFKNDRGGTRAPSQSSRSQGTAVGSGSRPNAGKIGIETTAPSNPRTLDRAPPSYLK